MQRYDIAIIGGGSGGLVAAATATGMGASVLLVEGRKMGGDCLNYGCVPSKTFLKSAHMAEKIARASDYGIDVDFSEAHIERVMERVRKIIATIAPHDSKERFESLGADVVEGMGKLTSPNSINVNGKEYFAKRILIATGSRAMIPPIKGLSDVPYYTNETIFDMVEKPKRLIVLGGGPIGLELGQGFAHLGVHVTVIDGGDSLFRRDEPEVAPILEEKLRSDGVSLCLGAKIERVYKDDNGISVCITQNGREDEVKADALLVALGRRPNTEELGLNQVGIETDKRGYIKVNEKMQTSLKSVYACGDVCGGYLFTHIASYEAGIAVRNALVMNAFKKSYSNVAWTTYTEPEVAHVGYLESEAREKGVFAYAHIVKFSRNDRALAEDDADGLLKVIVNAKGIVVGATIVSQKAGEIIPFLSLMVTKKLKLTDAMGVIFQYPIEAEIIKTAAIEEFKRNVKPWQQSLIRKIVKGKK